MTSMTRDARTYDKLHLQVPPDASREARMQAVVDALWQAFADQGYSWVGFYLDQPQEPDDRRMILGPCRDKPACSPLGLHGACGRALLSRQTLIVRDVAQLGENYIACDPRDKSEIIIPLVDHGGTCWGVLDVDSHETSAFDTNDENGLRNVLRAVELVPG